MATKYTDFATLQYAAISDMSQAPNLKQYGGNVKYIDVKITGLTGATADPVYLARLPKGSRLIPALCSVDYGDPGDALTGKIGYIYDDATGDDDGFGAGLALGNAAGRKAFTEAGTLGAALTTPVQFSDDAWIYVTWTTATNAVSADQTWHLAYTNG